MKKILVTLFCLFGLLASPSFAQSTAQETVLGELTTGGKFTPFSSSFQLPIAVYDSGNHSGFCYTSNGSSSAATFQVCGGGGGGSSVAINNTTSNVNYFPLFAIGATTTASTIYVDTASPWNYNASTGLTSILGITTTSFTNNGNASLTGTTTVNNLNITGALTGAVKGTNGQLQFNGNGSFSGLSASTTSQTALAGLIGNPPFYAANYGVLANGISVTDITSTSASAVVSSTSHSFTSADNGKLFSGYIGTNVSTTGTVASGSNTITSLASLTGLQLGQSIIGGNIPAGTKIIDFLSATSLQMDRDATGAATGEALTFVNVLNTTISSTSGGNATLAANAGTSIAGIGRATFGTDDTTAWNALDATVSTAGGGLIVMPLGISPITNSVIIDNNISIMGQGAGKSIFKWMSTGNQSTPAIESRQQANGIGPTTCDYSAAHLQRNNQFSYFEVDNESATAGSYQVQAKGLGFSCTERSDLNHLYVHDTLATGLATDNGYPTLVHDNVIVNPGRFGGGQPGSNGNPGSNGVGEGVASSGLDSYSLNNNIVINPAHYGIFTESEASATTNAKVVVDGNLVIAGANSQNSAVASQSPAGIGNSGAANFSAAGNVIYGAGTEAPNYVGIATDTGTLTNPSGIHTVISGNTVANLGSTGIIVNYNATAPSSSQAAAVVINGNLVFNTGIGGTGNPGIELLPNASGNTMDGVVMSNNIVNGSGSCGIALLAINAGSVIKDLSMTGNILSNNGTVTATDYRKSGICINNITGSNWTIEDNTAYDDATSTEKYALSINSGTITNAFIQNNNFNGVTTKGFNVVGGTIAGLVQNNYSSAFSISGCSATTPVGTGLTGKFTSGTSGTCAVTITPNGTSSISANNGYVCGSFLDATTTADTASWSQIGSTTTSATLQGTTVSSDVVSFTCAPY